MTIRLVMTACGTSIPGYFGGRRVMSVKNITNITTVARAIGGFGYCAGALTSNNKLSERNVEGTKNVSKNKDEGRTDRS